MSLDNLYGKLEKILKLHKSLNEIAKRKTDIIIKSDADALKLILKDENKHIQAIQKLSSELSDIGNAILDSDEISGAATISAIIENAESHDKMKLQKVKADLEEQVDVLKRQNNLNQDLLEQSLQFVNLSLDLLIPDLDTFNYSSNNESNEDISQNKRSLFDSKA